MKTKIALLCLIALISWPVARATAQEAGKRYPRNIVAGDGDFLTRWRFPDEDAPRMMLPTTRRPQPSGVTGVSTWNGGTGNWADGTMWSPTGVPNDSMADVFVDGGKTGVNSVVTMINGGFSVGRLTIDLGDTVVEGNNNDLTIVAGGFSGSGTIINNGTLSLNSTGNGTRLNINGGNVTLSGSGVLTLGSTGHDQITGDANGRLLTNQGNTISGAGSIGANILDITNQALIDANLAGNTLALDPFQTLTNSGTLRASNGGLLFLANGTYANTGGTILATGSGSVVQLGSLANVNGGTLSTASGGLIRTGAGGVVTLGNLSNTGAYEAENNSNTTLIGTIANSGTITLNSTGNGTALVITSAGATLTGGGNIVLGSAGPNLISGDNTGSLLTNLNNTISGVGSVGVDGTRLDINNQGLIDANVMGGTLGLIATSTFTNSGTLRASNGGLLQLSKAAYANTGGTILATGAGSVVQLATDANVSGGTLSTASGGLIRTGVGQRVTFGNLSNTGAYEAENNSTTTLVGTIANSGTITLNSSGNTTLLQITSSGATLTGGGNIILGSGGPNLITANSGGGVLTNQNNTISGAGNIGGNAIDLVNGGVIDANQTSALAIDPLSSLTNNAGGTLRGSGSGGLVLADGTYTNNGTIEALNGSSVFMNTTDTTLTNNMAGVLTGGRYRAIASGAGAILTIRGANITQLASGTEVDLSGAGSVFQVNSTALETSLTDNSGILRVLGNRNYSNANGLTNEGTIELGGGIFTAPTFTSSSSGELFGFGSVTVRPDNSGLVRAVGGTLSLTNGVGSSGTVQIDPSGLLDLSGSGGASSADFLTENGNAAGSLNLGSQNFVVGRDYTNASFGVGNTFNPRANVSGSGLIVAAGNVGQTLSGNITNGNTASATMSFGNVHVGDAPTQNYQINNTGTSGPVLRGALQTSVNGGNITDGRLGGSGVTASNFGPIALGANTGNLGVTFNATAAGALTGQVLHVINNFDNVTDQNLTITGAAYRYANPTGHSPEPVNFGNFHVGDSVSSIFLSLTNNVPNDGFSEALNAAIGGATGGVTTNGGTFSLLAPGATNNSSLSVGINTATAGNKDGTATIALQSDGTGSSGLGLTNLTSQTVNVTGSVFRFAAPSAHSPEPVVLANQHVGDSLTQALSLTNSAASDGFSERLDASFTSTTGNATASGSFALLNAGATNSSSLLVGVDSSAAGARSGTATIHLVSDGSGTSGLANTTLTSQTVNISGNVYRLASASTHSPEPVSFGVVHIGDTPSRAITVTNTATNDAFSEKLDGSFSATTGGVTASGSFLLLAPGSSSSSLSVGIDTSSVGNKNGTGTIGLVSNGTGTSGLANTNLTSQTVNVTGQVNFFADPVIIFKSGSATLTMNSPTSFTLSFGQVAQNSGTYLASFGVQNFLHNATFQDSLGGTFDISMVSHFGTSGTGAFANIAPGSALDPNISFDSSMGIGSYTDTLLLNPTSGNASGTSTLNQIQLTLQGTIAVVPEPSTWVMFALGLGLIPCTKRFRKISPF